VIYHTIQTNLASREAITYNTKKDPILIGEKKINEVMVQFLPLGIDEIYTSNF
jgi:hypothetical protein